MINRQWLLAAHPDGPVERHHFALTEAPVPVCAPGSGKVLLRNELLLCAPTIRNWISGNRSSYYPTVEIGQPVMAPGVGRVIASADERYPLGARLAGAVSWQDYQLVDPSGYQVVPDGVAAADALGIFGMNALTAYFGITDVCRPVGGETLLVSGAAGSVGSIAAQIARIKGARVIGICGGSEKATWLRESCGISLVIDYKADDIAAKLDELAPDGIDLFFDNVGGTLLASVVTRMRRHGRIALCGQIATYDAAEQAPSLDMMRIIYGALELRGFLVSDYWDRYPQAINDLSEWNSAGLLAHREDVRDGFADLPETFAALFRGSNTGTLIARIADGEGRAL